MRNMAPSDPEYQVLMTRRVKLIERANHGRE
jgi:hypothetical protein